MSPENLDDLTRGMSEKPPHSRITIHDIAREARVSISIVSRVVNQNVPPAEKTCAGYLSHPLVKFTYSVGF